MAKINFRNLLEKRGFYAAICACLIAVAAFSWAAADKAKMKKDKENKTVSSQSSSPATAQNSAVAEIVSDVPYSTPEEKSEVEAKATEAEVSENEEPVPEASFFVFPVAGSIYKNFDGENLQYSETYKDWRVHLGLDIAADIGTAVHSAANGRVSKIYEDEIMGTVAEIDHGGGMVGFYCGLNKKPQINVGDNVNAGQVIGAIDTIPGECVETPHIHFALSKDGKWVNPSDYITAE